MISEGSRDTEDFSFDHGNILNSNTISQYYYIIIYLFICIYLFIYCIFYYLGEHKKKKWTDPKLLYGLRTWSNARGTKIW